MDFRSVQPELQDDKVVHLTGEVYSDLLKLARQYWQFAQAEVHQLSWHTLKTIGLIAVVAVATGASLVLALVTLALSLVYYFQLEAWVGFAIVTGVAAVITGFCVIVLIQSIAWMRPKTMSNEKGYISG